MNIFPQLLFEMIRNKKMIWFFPAKVKVSVEKLTFHLMKMRILILALSLTNSRTWAKLLNLFMPQFCHLQNGNNYQSTLLSCDLKIE